MTKICTRCNTTFIKSPVEKRRGGQCGPCYNKRCTASAKAYREKLRIEDPDKLARYYKRANLYKYGLNYDEFQLMLQIQDNKCAICNISSPLVVDHNHTTDKIRGLICSNCNKGLGMFKEDQKIFESAIKYLAERN